MSELMNIPNLRFPDFSDDWQVSKLGDVTSKIGSGSTPRGGEEVYTSDGILFIRSQNVKRNILDLTDSTFIPEEVHFQMSGSEVKSNDVLLNITGASIGRSCVVPSSVITGNVNQHVCIVRTGRHLEPNFLQPFLASRRGQKLIYQGQTGSGREGLNFQSIRSFKLSLPTKPEQQKIAAFLAAVDSKIEQLSKKQALLGEYKKGLMQQIFSQAIRFKADDGSAFPVWEEKNIVELAKTSIGLVTSMTPYYVDKGVPLIRNNDIFQNKIRKEKLIRLDYEFDQLNKNRRLFTNDIVTVHTGNIGASAVIDEELNGCQGFATLNTRIKNQNEISSSFLCWYYNSTRNIKYALSMATGDGRSNYNLKDFNKATIPVPSLPEQTKIAAFLTAADNKIEQVGKQFDESKQFKKALLQQMFV